MFWSCPHLRTFWADVFQAYSAIFDVNIPPNPVCGIFSFTDETCSLKGKARVVIAFTSLLARCLILLLWKEQTPTRFSRWISDIMSFLKLEKNQTHAERLHSEFWENLDPFPYVLREPANLTTTHTLDNGASPYLHSVFFLFSFFLFFFSLFVCLCQFVFS